MDLTSPLPKQNFIAIGSSQHLHPHCSHQSMSKNFRTVLIELLQFLLKTFKAFCKRNWGDPQIVSMNMLTRLLLLQPQQHRLISSSPHPSFASLNNMFLTDLDWNLLCLGSWCKAQRLPRGCSYKGLETWNRGYIGGRSKFCLHCCSHM